MENQTAYLTKAGTFEIKPSPMPVPGPEEVLVEIKHVGICGSDLTFFADPTIGGHLPTKLPIVLGHECAGVVVDKGQNVRELAKGDLVALEPGIPCGSCAYCRAGRYNLCPEVSFMAAPPFQTGALSKYLVHPAKMAFRLPPGMDSLDGALMEPFSVGLHAARRAGIVPGSHVVILGAGCIGLMCLLACKLFGATDILIADLMAHRLERAQSLGAETIHSGQTDTTQAVMEHTENHGADFVFEAAGHPQTMALTSSLVKAGGKIITVGNIHAPVPFSFIDTAMKEADIISVFRYANTYPLARKAIAAGLTPVRKVVSHVFPFSQVQPAFETALKGSENAVKVVIEM